MPGKIREIYLDDKIIPIREFNLSWMEDGSIMVMIAKRRSGKSWVCRAILKHLSERGFPGGVIISKTENNNPFYSGFIPDLFIHYNYSNRILQNVFTRQEKIIDKKKEKEKKGKTLDPRIYIVMDDCLADAKDWKTAEPILGIFYNGRHLQMTFLLTMQDCLGIKPALRNNTDYTFLLSNNMENEQKRIHSNYGAVIGKFNTFKEFFTTITEDHCCLVINNAGSSNDFLDIVFWYKAKYIPDKLLGSHEFIKFHKKRYDKEWKKKVGGFF